MSPEKQPWNQKVVCPESLCTKHTPRLLFKFQLFSHILGNQKFGHQAHQLGDYQLGCLASWVAPGKLPPRELASTVHHRSPGRQVWESSSWETTQTFFPQLMEPASGRDGCLRQWATPERAEKNTAQLAAHQVGYTMSGFLQWSKELITQPSHQLRSQAAQRHPFRLMIPPKSTLEGRWGKTPSHQWSTEENWSFCKLFGKVKKGGPWPTNIIGILHS